MVFFKSLNKRYVFQLTEFEHKGVSESMDSDDRNFSSVKPEQIFHFFKTGIFYSRSALKRIRPMFQIFWHYLNIYYESKLNTNVKVRTVSIFTWTGLILQGMK